MMLNVKRIANCDVFHSQGIKTDFERLYGGQTVAQSLLSASLTVPDDTPVHSLHTYFILAGDCNKEILFEVGSFSYMLAWNL
jgi:acyl-CoA thioesterase-2